MECRTRSCLLCVAMLCIAGCGIRTWHGDATIDHKPALRFQEGVTVLKLKAIPVSARAIHRLKVRDLAPALYPDEVRPVAKTGGEFRAPQEPPLQLHVRIEDLDGRLIHAERVLMPDGGAKLTPPFDVLTSYDVVIEVLRPSDRPGDEVALWGTSF